MAIGVHGEPCSEAIRTSIAPAEIVTFTDLFDRVRKRGRWKENTIWRHLMSCVVNLPPARHEWPGTKPFLFLHPDGRYELFNPQKHPAQPYKG